MPAGARPRLGVVGGGTMGTGIGEVAALAGFPVVIYDLTDELLARGRARLEASLQRAVARGRLKPAAARDALARIAWTTAFEALGDAAAVIEAIPEDLTLKRDVFRRLDETCADARLLASNTSSLSISAIAAATRRPDRIIGMHFFNPVPAMALVEVVRGAQTADRTADAAVALAEAMGKTPVRVAEGPGFLVNRVARPFGGEALRVLAEGVAPVEVIDRIMREAGGYRMGPFELLDLIGLDVNLAVSRAIYEAFFHDPRYRPHPLQQQMVDAGLLGRKTGRGFYAYTERGEPVRGDSAAGPPPRWEALPTETRVLLVGTGRVADALAARLRAVDLPLAVSEGSPAGAAAPAALATVVIDAALAPAQEKAETLARLEAMLPPQTLLLTLTLTASTTTAARLTGRPERVVGFAALPPASGRWLVEVQPGLRTDPAAARRAQAFWALAGAEAIAIGEGPGGVYPRIQAMLSHEAVVAWAEAIASAAAIDTAMRLGVNYPQGPIARAEAVGLEVILAIMEGLYQETRDPRYRSHPALRRLVAAGRTRIEETAR
ncbi:MAG: 3-hydroxyacyl-CoA dehydrogenase NAD-binding domain-containing protein [Armatimonadota bacterium]|nr:3-hydroxyacyl-CoA dehydrogenase NAD-binding domain-containing protein [Armatimonadota bacterium]